MSGMGRDLSLDWISRTLYVVENNGEQGTSSIMGYHMDQQLYTPVIGSEDNNIGAVISDPYTRSASQCISERLVNVNTVNACVPITLKAAFQNRNMCTYMKNGI